MKIGREESSESENESDEEDEEEDGGLSDESANECLKRPEAEQKEPPRASPPDKGPEPGREQPGAGPEEPTAEEGEPEEPRPKRKRRHRCAPGGRAEGGASPRAGRGFSLREASSAGCPLSRPARRLLCSPPRLLSINLANCKYESGE